MTNRNNQPSWQTQPRTTKAQEKFRSELRRNGRPTRPTDLQSRVRDILARPGARSPTGMLNPRVVSIEEARLIAEYESRQAPPISRPQSISGAQAISDIGLAGFQTPETELPSPRRATPPSEVADVRRQFLEEFQALSPAEERMVAAYQAAPPIPHSRHLRI